MRLLNEADKLLLLRIKVIIAGLSFVCWGQCLFANGDLPLTFNNLSDCVEAEIGSIRIMKEKNPLINGAQTLIKTADPGPYMSGDFVEFDILISCSSLTTGCGAATITDVIPPELDYISTNNPVGTTVTFNPTSDELTLEIPNLNDGDSFIFTVTTQIPVDVTPGSTITNTACSTITNASNPTNETVCADASIDIDPTAPSPMWYIDKQLQSSIVVDEPVDYRIRLCAEQLSGNTNLGGVTITDQLPAGVTVLDTGGGTYDAGMNTITWTEGDILLSDLYSPSTNPTADRCVDKNITIIYPSTAGYMPGQMVTNTGTFNAVSEPGNMPVSDSDPQTDPIISPAPNSNLTKTAAPSTVFAGDSFEFRIDIENNGNVPLVDYVVTDVWTHGLPLLNAEMPELTNGVYLFIFETTVDGGSTWTLQSDMATENQQFAFNISDGINGVRLTPYTDIDGNPGSPNELLTGTDSGNGSSGRFRLTHNVPQGTPDGTTYLNVASDASVNIDFIPDTAEATATVIPVPPDNSEPFIDKSILSSSVDPGEEFTVRLRGFNNPGGEICIQDPVVYDFLPPEMLYVGNPTWAPQGTNGSAPAPNVLVTPDFNNTGQTLVSFSWSATPPTGATALDGSPALPNSYCFVANGGTNGSQRSAINFNAVFAPGTATGTYSNTAFLNLEDNTLDECDCPTLDTYDLDGDGDTSEVFCDCNSDNINLTPSAVLVGEKWVKGDPNLPNIDDPNSTPVIDDAACPTFSDGFTRFPCIAQGAPGSIYEYKLIAINYGTEPLTEYVLYDILPYVGDFGVSEALSTSPRDSEWQPELVAISPDNPFTSSIMPMLEYSMSPNPCRPELSMSTDESGWQTTCTDDWSATPPTDLGDVRAIRLKVPFSEPDNWPPGDSIIISVNMRIPFDTDFESITWNSMAHRVTNATDGTRLLSAEPRKTGIQVPPQSSIPCLIVLSSFTQSVCEDAGTSSDSSDDYFSVTIEAIRSGTGSTQYEVALNAETDGTGGVLLGLTDYGTSITLGSGINGVPGTFSADGNSTYTLTIRDSMTPTCFTTFTSTPVNSCSMSPVLYSLGNRVFLDSDNNGAQDGTESGIDGVNLQLLNADGTPYDSDPATPGTQILTVTTGNDGYYRFDELPAGDYIVEVLASNFSSGSGTLENLQTSTGAAQETSPNIDGDLNDNGLDVLVANAVRSGIISLGGVEPTSENEPGTYATGSTTGTPAADTESNLTVDFGFFPLPREDYPDFEDPSNPCADLPCHTVSNDIYLGSGVTNDNAGSGDTSASSDIDDGVNISPDFDAVPGNTIRFPVSIFNNTGNDAYLRAWIDWNADGDFEDAGEQIYNMVNNTGGAYTEVISVIVPGSASINTELAMRWRISTDDTNSADPCGTGTCAADGEIEDYLLRFACPTPLCLPITTLIRD